MIDGGATHIVAAVEMHIDDAVPVLVRHLVEHHVAQDSGGIDNRVQAFERVPRLFDYVPHARAAGHRIGIRDGLSTRCLDLARDDFCWPCRAFVAASNAAAQIVHHHASALARGQERTLLADAVCPAGDENNLAFQHSHGLPPQCLLCGA